MSARASCCHHPHCTEALANRTAYAERFREIGNQAYPEAHILLVIARSGLVRTSQLRGPFFTQFAEIEGFRLAVRLSQCRSWLLC